MPRFFSHLTFVLFTITALSGIWMRAVPFNFGLTLNYANVLHAHSHIAILGWAFLGAFIVLLAILWPAIKSKTHAIILTIVLFTVSILMFITFLYEGYATYSIIMSTIHIFVEYWAIIFIYKQLRFQDQLPNIGKLFINGSLIALLISSIGPFSLGFLSANSLQGTYLFNMAIYFYLHFQYNGWLSLFLIGLFLFIIHRKGIKLSTRLLKYGFWIYFLSLFPWYLLSVLWADLGGYSRPLATIGALGQWIGALFILISIKRTWSSIRKALSLLTATSLIITFILLFFKSTMELGLISPTLADLVYDTRSIIIGYLHFTLLGFVSLFILTQYQMIGLLDSNRKSVIYGQIVFLSGFLLNELILFMVGLGSWLDIPLIPYSTQGLLIASILLAIGVTMIWSSIMTVGKCIAIKR